VHVLDYSFIYKDNIMVELALIVEKPKEILASGFGEYARKEMDHFWSGLTLKTNASQHSD